MVKKKASARRARRTHNAAFKARVALAALRGLRRMKRPSARCRRWPEPRNMISAVRPELHTAPVGSSQAPTAAVDNSAPEPASPQSTYKWGKLFKQAGPLLSRRRARFAGCRALSRIRERRAADAACGGV